MPLARHGAVDGDRSRRVAFSVKEKSAGALRGSAFFLCAALFLFRRFRVSACVGPDSGWKAKELFVICSPYPPPPLGGTFGISGLDSGNYGIPCRQSRHFISLTAKVVKTFELRVKKRLFWDASAKVVIALWLRAKSSKHLGYGCRDANALPQLEWHFPPTLIVRVGGKLLCQLFFGFIWFSWYELGGFLGVEGLDRKTGVRGREEGSEKAGREFQRDGGRQYRVAAPCGLCSGLRQCGSVLRTRLDYGTAKAVPLARHGATALGRAVRACGPAFMARLKPCP